MRLNSLSSHDVVVVAGSEICDSREIPRFNSLYSDRIYFTFLSYQASFVQTWFSLIHTESTSLRLPFKSIVRVTSPFGSWPDTRSPLLGWRCQVAVIQLDGIV